MISIDTMNDIIRQLTGTELCILIQLLQYTENSVTIRGLARLLGLSYPLIHQAVQKLKKKNIIEIIPVPPAHIIKIRKDAPQDSLLIAEIEAKKRFSSTHFWIQMCKEDIIRNSNFESFILIVFGSYAKKKQNSQSDIDLLFIVPKKENIQTAEVALKSTITQVRKHGIIVTEKDFLTMIQNKETFNVGNEARKNHIILTGVERYYQLLTKGGIYYDT